MAARLREWTEEDRAGLRIQRSLSGAAKDWERLGRDDGALLRGSRLAEAVEWRDDRQPALNELEREFLTVSEAASERERVTRRRRTQLAMGAVAIVILASVVVAVAALFAARARAIAASQDLAAQSGAITDTDPGLAFTLAREALKRHDTAQAENAMRQATLTYRVTAVARASEGLTYAPDPSPDGRFAVTPGADGKVILWRLGRALSKKTLTTHADEALGAAFDPDAKLVASVSYNGEVALTPVSGGQSKTLLRLAGADKEFGYSIDAGLKKTRPHRQQEARRCVAERPADG